LFEHDPFGKPVPTFPDHALKHNTATPAGNPDDPTALLRAAEQQLETLGQLGLRVYIEACAASGIVNNVAINNRSLRANNYFGLGTPA
jgi:hypothetical protein